MGSTYVLAWFLQVAEHGHTLADGVLPGWEAFRLALSPLWRESNGSTIDAALCVGSALTNIAFVACFARLARRSPIAKRSWNVLLLAAVLVNAFWIVDGSLKEMRAGYWLWLASFVLLSGVAYFRRETHPGAAKS